MIDLIFWILLLALFAEILGTMAGFGSSTIFLPIMLLFFDFKTALVLVAIYHMSGNIARIGFFKYGFDRRLLLTFGFPGLIFTLAGSLLVPYFSQPLLKLILGTFLIFYVSLSLYKTGISFNPNLKNSVIGGSLSGFFAGLIGTGGVLRAAFLSSFKIDKSVYIATIAVISLAVDLTRIPVYLLGGYLTSDFYNLVPLLFLTAIAGSFIGKQVVNKIPQKSFRKLVMVFIAVFSLKFICDGIIFYL